MDSADPADYLVAMVDICRLNSGAQVDRVAHAALGAAAELGPVVDSVEEAESGLLAHLVAAREVS